jgi:hypothetical protein
MKKSLMVRLAILLLISSTLSGCFWGPGYGPQGGRDVHERDRGGHHEDDHGDNHGDDHGDH